VYVGRLREIAYGDNYCDTRGRALSIISWGGLKRLIIAHDWIKERDDRLFDNICYEWGIFEHPVVYFMCDGKIIPSSIRKETGKAVLRDW